MPRFGLSLLLIITYLITVLIIYLLPVLLGYERSGVVGGLSIESTETSVVHGLGGGLAKNTKNATYLNIYATLQPALIGKKHAL